MVRLCPLPSRPGRVSTCSPGVRGSPGLPRLVGRASRTGSPSEATPWNYVADMVTLPPAKREDVRCRPSAGRLIGIASARRDRRLASVTHRPRRCRGWSGSALLGLPLTCATRTMPDYAHDLEASGRPRRMACPDRPMLPRRARVACLRPASGSMRPSPRPGVAGQPPLGRFDAIRVRCWFCAGGLPTCSRATAEIDRRGPGPACTSSRRMHAPTSWPRAVAVGGVPAMRRAVGRGGRQS